MRERQNAESQRRGAPSSFAQNTAENNPNKKKKRTVIDALRGPDVRKNGFVKKTDAVRVRGGIDRQMLFIIILMLCFGSIMVFSASYATANSEKGDSFYYIKRQLVFVALGLIVMIGVSFFDYRIIRRVTPIMFIGVAVLLLVVLVIGTAEGVAKRWLYIGPISFQPSELMKPVLALFLANFFAINQEKITNYRDFRQSSVWGNAIPLCIIAFVCVEIVLERHLSGTIIMFFIGLVVIFAGGGRKFWIIVSGGVVGVFAGFAYIAFEYVRKRVDIFFHPENYSVTDETWQTIQGLNAVGSGGFLGVGLGNSYQKYSFVSQPQNDFIFSIVCEELGFVGAVAVIALFMLFVWRGFVIAMKAPDTFSSLAVIGIVSHVAIQAILNIAVVTNLIPNTGITLPFFSYGGSAILILMAEMGVILAISRYSYKED